MRIAEPITLAVIVLALFVALVASAGAGPADDVGAPLGQDDEMANETTTDSMGGGMDETTDGEMMSDCQTTRTMDETTSEMGNESMGDGMDDESMGDETATESIDGMDGTTSEMGTETMGEGMTTMDCPTTESMDDETTAMMDDTTDGMSDDVAETTEMMDDTTTDAGGSSAFAPGFGPVVALVALVGAALYVARRE